MRQEVTLLSASFGTDGSAIPANVGVNPSLTITAMAEPFLMSSCRCSET